MIRVVIIGSGNIAHTRHIPNIQRSKRAVLYGVYNRSVEHSLLDAEKFGCRAYRTVDEIMTDPKVDAIIVCTPASTHCEYTLAALKAGKHVLCEKPMSASVEEAKLMLEASEKSAGKLMIAHNQRYYQPHQKAKELLEAGIIGKVLNVRSCLGVNIPPINDSHIDNDAGREVLCHRVDLMHYLLGSYVAGITARLTRVDESGRNVHVCQWDDTAMAIMEYENGVIGSFVASRISRNGNDRTTRFFGTKGSITLYAQNAHVCVELEDGEVINYQLPHVPSQREVEQTQVDEAFFQSIEEDTPSPVSALDGYKVMEVLEGIYRSNADGCYVKLIK